MRRASSLRTAFRRFKMRTGSWYSKGAGSCRTGSMRTSSLHPAPLPISRGGSLFKDGWRD